MYATDTSKNQMDMEWQLERSFGKAKGIIKYVCMKLNDETRLLYLEAGASGIGLRAALLQLSTRQSNS